MSTANTSVQAASQPATHGDGQHRPDTSAAESLEMTNLPETQPHTKAAHPPAAQPEMIESTTSPPQRAQLGRSETADVFLGPDGAAPSNAATDSTEPILRISLMLITGARHPYTISSRYLASRKVTAVDATGNFDPREISAYKLKELIWTDWRQEWEPKPRDPAAIRLIILGRMLDDNSQLKGECFEA